MTDQSPLAIYNCAMSDATQSLGNLVDETTSTVASEAAASAANNVADSIPEPQQTTVVVEEANDTTATGLQTAAHIKQIIREENDKYITELIAMQAAEAANKPPPEPDVVVVTETTGPPAPPASELDTDDTAPKRDESPPMAKSHPYFKPIGKRKAKKS